MGRRATFLKPLKAASILVLPGEAKIEEICSRRDVVERVAQVGAVPDWLAARHAVRRRPQFRWIAGS
jgi:hypothetical protein